MGCYIIAVIVNGRWWIIAIKVDKFLTCLSKSKTEVVTIKLYLHVLMSNLKLADRDLLPFIKICGISIAAPRLPVIFFSGVIFSSMLGVVGSLSTCRHALHVKDHVRVDYASYGHDD